jgi:hypothetical protein
MSHKANWCENPYFTMSSQTPCPSTKLRRVAKLQGLGSRRGILLDPIVTSMRGRKGAIHYDSIETEITTQEEWPFESLLAHRNFKGEDEYLVQWSPAWEKGSPISNLRDAPRMLKETRVKMWTESTLVAPSGEDVGTATKMVADARVVMAKWSKKL